MSWLKIITVPFAVGLGAAVAYRMNTEAMAVVVGVACGVLASVLLATILQVIVNRRYNHRAANGGTARPARDYPPVVIVTGGDARQLAPPHWQGDRLTRTTDLDLRLDVPEEDGIVFVDDLA